MQLTLGRRWILELRFSIAMRKQVDDACTAVRGCVQRNTRQRDRAMQWEQDKARGMMLRGWDRTIR